MTDPRELLETELDAVAAGSGRRVELDHMGAYNFQIEIEGVAAGHVVRAGYIGETEKNVDGD